MLLLLVVTSKHSSWLCVFKNISKWPPTYLCNELVLHTSNDISDIFSLKGESAESKWCVSTHPSFPSSDSTMFSWTSQFSI